MSAPLREYVMFLAADDAVLHTEEGASAHAVHDSRSRWERIWELRERIFEIAHSHPVGPLAFSAEDETTMAAIQSGLGRSVVFSVVAPDGMLRREGLADVLVGDEPSWASTLRTLSGMTETNKPHEE